MTLDLAQTIAPAEVAQQPAPAAGRTGTDVLGRIGNLETRVARSVSEIDAAQAVRYRVFAEEMNAQLSPDAVLQVAAGESLLLKLNAEDMYALNETGTDIVRRVCDGNTLGALVEHLAQSFAAAPAEIERDVRALLDDLVARGLLIARDEGE